MAGARFLCPVVCGAAEVKAEKNQALPERMISMDEDFMIGYEGLEIDALTRDGRTVPLFRKGTWAF